MSPCTGHRNMALFTFIAGKSSPAILVQRETLYRPQKMLDAAAVYIHITLLNMCMHGYMFMSFTAAHGYLDDRSFLKTD